MNKSFLKRSVFGFQNDFFILIVISVVFSGGCVAGAFFSRFISENDPAVSYIFDTVELVQNGHDVFPGIFIVFFDSVKLYLLIFLLAFSAGGFFLTPLVVAVESFSLAFSVSLFVRVLGKRGILFTLTLLGAEAVLTVPLLIIMALLSARTSMSMMDKFNGADHYATLNRKKFLKLFFVFLSLLFLVAVFQKYVISELLIYTI